MSNSHWYFVSASDSPRIKMENKIFLISSMGRSDKKSILEIGSLNHGHVPHVPLFGLFFKVGLFLGVIPYQISYDHTRNTWKAKITTPRLVTY